MEEILKRNEELYNDFYERTKNYGRSQFVKFILAEEEEKRLLNNQNTKLLNINKKLQQENKELKRNCNIGNENLSFYIQENKELQNKIDNYKNLEQSLTFIKNRIKQGMTQENINKCAIELVNNYLKGGKNE